VLRLLTALSSGPLSASELRNALAIRHRPTFRQNYLQPGLRQGLIELTLPEKPNSRFQKYRLTETGRSLLTEAADREQK
jgi:hypothetical protein